MIFLLCYSSESGFSEVSSLHFYLENIVPFHLFGCENTSSVHTCMLSSKCPLPIAAFTIQCMSHHPEAAAVLYPLVAALNFVGECCPMHSCWQTAGCCTEATGRASEVTCMQRGDQGGV